MSVTIYHNPRCSKSRETMKLLEEQNVEINTVEYLKNGLTKDEVLGLIKKLDVGSEKLVRTKEDLYKSLGASIETDDQVATLLAGNPSLLERPVVIYNDQAVLGRPPENIKKLF